MVMGHTFAATLSGLGGLGLVHREPATATPFCQCGPEASAGAVRLEVNGEEVALHLPETGLSGGPAAVWAPAGIYSR